MHKATILNPTPIILSVT